MRFIISLVLFNILSIIALQAKEKANIKDDDVIIAKVNNDIIYKSEVDAIIDDFQKNGTVIDNKTRDTLIQKLIEQKIVAQYAKKQGYDKRPLVQKQIEIMTDMVLRDSYFSDFISQKVTPKIIKAEFDKKMLHFKPKYEYKASHILLDSQEKAQEISKKITKNLKFEDLAKQYSSDSNAQNGGDLGYFSDEMMVESFSNAVSKLAINQISEPVQTDFGWHIIKLVDKRELPKPTFEQLLPQIRTQLAREFMNKNLSELKAKSDIKIYSVLQKKQK